MTRYAVAVGSNGSRGLVGLEDLSPLTTVSGVRAVVMSRSDILVNVVELPSLSPREIEGFLAYRIRGLYPGQPDETEIDYRVLSWGGRRYAVLFLVQRQVLEEHRRAAQGRPLILPYSLIAPLLHRPAPNRTTVGLLWHATWIDALVLEPGTPPRSVALPRAGSVAADLDRLESLLEVAGAVEWRIVAIEPELATLRRTLERRARGPGPVTVVPLERAVRRLGHRAPAPFTRRARPAGIPRRVRVPIALLAAAALSFLALKRSVDRDAAYASLLHRSVVERQARAETLAVLQREIDALRADLDALRTNRPPDPGRVLGELALVLGTGARLESFSLENGLFQLEAVGSNPLELMERFASSESFDDVRLLQIVPEKDGVRELFRLTGRVR